MGLVVDVALNTAIADLDEALRKLLRRELERHGFEGVEISFDAPSKDWSDKLTGPTVDLFLYDLREATERAQSTPTERRGNGQARVTPPPLQLELTYAVTAWTRAVEDEHRLLSQVLSVLFSYDRLPEDVLQGEGDTVLREARTSVGRPREEKADFWTSVGGQYKVSIDFVVQVTLESGATFVRGPEVRTQTIRARAIDAPPGRMVELHRVGGTVKDKDGAPVAAAWVVVPEAGLWTATDRDGRFRLNRIHPGKHELVIRSPSGAEETVTAEVPGEALDVVMSGKSGSRKSGAATGSKRRSSKR